MTRDGLQNPPPPEVLNFDALNLRLGFSEGLWPCPPRDKVPLMLISSKLMLVKCNSCFIVNFIYN